jgi:hypothetical protein
LKEVKSIQNIQLIIYSVAFLCDDGDLVESLVDGKYDISIYTSPSLKYIYLDVMTSDVERI